MYQNQKKNYLLYFAVFLFISVALLFYFDWQNSHRKFTFAMLDVGQGDALFIESPSGKQILIDAGPNKKVLSELSKVMSPFDRSLDAIIITNPDADHIEGFLDILKNYKVGTVFESGTVSDSKTYESLENKIRDKKISDVLLKKGMRLNLGSGVALDVLFPDRDVSSWDTNYGSIVARLSYGNTSVMLTGDAPAEIEKIILAENNSDNLKSMILKVAHHGSKYSSSREFLKAVAPKYSFISVGKNNKYNHPNQETLDVLSEFNTQILRTDLDGTIILKCDKIDVCKINKLKN